MPGPHSACTTMQTRSCGLPNLTTRFADVTSKLPIATLDLCLNGLEFLGDENVRLY
jgi:hypothetical protein